MRKLFDHINKIQISDKEQSQLGHDIYFTTQELRYLRMGGVSESDSFTMITQVYVRVVLIIPRVSGVRPLVASGVPCWSVVAVQV